VSSRKEQKEQARQAREAKQQEMAAADAKRRRLTIIGGVVGLALIAVVVAIVVSTSSSTKSDSSQATEVNKRYEGIPQKGNVLGEEGAKAVIVEFADLRCPYCKDFSEGSMPTIVDELIRPGKAKYIFRNLTMLDGASASGTDSTNAAKYAGATGLQDKMFPFIDLFYLNQGLENQDYVTETFLKDIAKQITGLDPDEAWTQRNSPQVANLLKKADDQADELGVQGTPTIYVGRDENSLRKISVSDLSDPSAIISAVEALQ
jgi:protein-disulfide isomerase